VSRYDLSEPALADLDAILSYVAERRPRAARKLHSDLEAAFERISDLPDSGVLVQPRTGPPFHRALVGDYHVLYDHQARPVRIERILHGRRDLWALLDERAET
jgi:toxin ParE1/3/4